MKIKPKQQRLNPNREYQTRKIKPKQQRLFPNNEDQTTTVKATEPKWQRLQQRWRRLHFLLWVFRFVDVPMFSSLVFGFVEVVPSFSSLVFGFVEVLLFVFGFRKDSSSTWIIFHLNSIST